MATRKNLIANGAEITPLTREELILSGAEVTPLNEKERTMTAAVSGGGGDTPTGTISITSNGTHDVAQYAAANVNVASDFSTCQVTIINNSSERINIPIPCTYDMEGSSGSYCSDVLSSNSEETFPCILYKGLCYSSLDNYVDLSVNCEGLISYDEGEFLITGDGTITISDAQVG
ncbi:hypothetical protein IJI69_00405 [Candidatus Saccharibacteria bacterium]|nr:hypothetical protein [Candidatus Saccharibacteria bacterium]MBQ6127150.1 hypothetical protein [Candidatus Saccharibacteria bacterium]